jgi:hypothetical protein
MQNNLCLLCENYLGGNKCNAFTNGIPEIILIGYSNHEKLLPEQENEIVFQPIEE